MLENRSFSDFDAAAHSVLEFLYHRLSFDLWMVTRTEGDDWIVLQALDHGYGVKEGSVFRWADSFCSQMVLGLGPCIAPRSAATLTRSTSATASPSVSRVAPGVFR